MSQYYNELARQRRAAAQRSQGPTLDDYRNLQQMYEKLHAEYERQGTELAEAEQELQIKNDALHAQAQELKQLEAELVFAKAALQQEEEEANEASSEADEDWADRYARLQAEMENLRKRWEQRHATETAESRHRILLDMLPLADHLEMALNHAGTQADSNDGSFIENIRATQRAFLEALKRYGVTPLDAKGQPFDPNLHEAVGQMGSDAVPEGAVAEVLQTGYQEGDKLLRPARVIVSSGSAG